MLEIGNFTHKKRTELVSLKGYCIATLDAGLDKLNLNDAALIQLLERQDPPLVFCRVNKTIVAVIKRTRSHTETHNLRQLHLQLPSHCCAVLNATDSILVMSYVRPFNQDPQISTLKCLLKSYNHRCLPWADMLVKSIVLQSICIFLKLQDHKLEFTHNDFKSDNIMLEYSPHPILDFGILRMNCFCVRVVLIDAETVTGAVYKTSPLLAKMSKSSMASFGLDFPFSPLTDFHLLCLELLYACKSLKPYWAREFVQFLEEFGIPVKYFSEPYVTNENRLNGIGRISLKQLGRSLLSMLQSPFFTELIVRP
jgi:serine/threonine protein kinase